MVKNKTIFVRALATLLTILMIMSIACIGILADEEAGSGSDSQSGESTTVTPDSTIPSSSSQESSSNQESSSTPEESSPEDSSDESSEESTSAPVETEPPKVVYGYLTIGSYKQSYVSGQSFDPTGISVVILYDNNSTETVPLSTYGNYAPTTLSASTKSVVVTIAPGIQESIPVSVSAKEVTNLRVDIDNIQIFKYSYLQGEKFETTGLKVTATFSDGSTETVPHDKLVPSVPGPLDTTNTKISLQYGGKTSNAVNITVIPVTSITAVPDDPSFALGQYQVFDKSRLTVTATYSNGATRVVTDYTVGGSLNVPGDISIPISYYSATTEVRATVYELTGIHADTDKLVKDSYNEREFFKPEGLVVYGEYAELGQSFEISGYTVTNTPLLPDEDGKALIVVTFMDILTDSFQIDVSPITELVITSQPNLLKYYEGEAINFTGLVVRAVFANGQYLDNFTAFTTPSESLYADAAKKPYITYGALTAEINANIVAMSAIGVIKNPTRILYTEGEIFDPTGIEIVAYYTDGTYTEVEIGACTFPTEPLEIYDRSVTVTYKEFSDTIEISVTDKVYAKALDAVVLPKVEYVSGQELSLEGLKLIVSFSDGSSKALELTEVTVAPAEGTQLFSGIDTKITVTYVHDEEQTITLEIPITVSEKQPISLIISQNPEKLVYTEGEKFDPKGMIIRAYYNDNTLEEITNYSFTKDPFIISSTSAEEVYVTISSGEAEVTLKVTVNPSIISKLLITTPPTKTTYKSGEYFDPAGMIVKATFANGVTVTVPSDMYDVSHTGTLSATDSVVTISFRGKSAPLTISVDGEIVTTPPTIETTTPEDSITTPEPITSPKDPETNPPTSETTTRDNGDETTTDPDATTQAPKPSNTGIKILFICLILFIVALVVVLIIYYRRHFC